MEFPAEWVAGGGALSLLAFAAFLAWRLVRLLNAQIDRDHDLHASHDACQRRLGIVVGIAIEHGWDFPPDFWDRSGEPASR